MSRTGVVTVSNLKRLFVIIELLIASFVIATSFGLLVELYFQGFSPTGDDPIQSDFQIVIALWFIGGAIFFDLYRRGPAWWN
jgi:hypothetical protein